MTLLNHCVVSHVRVGLGTAPGHGDRVSPVPDGAPPCGSLLGGLRAGSQGVHPVPPDVAPPSRVGLSTAPGHRVCTPCRSAPPPVGFGLGSAPGHRVCTPCRAGSALRVRVGLGSAASGRRGACP